MIKVENLSFKYKSPDARKVGSLNGAETYALEVIDRISLDISANSTTAIIGPSGCGKTTLLYLIAGLLPFEEGEIKINGETVTGIRSSTGVILQNYGLFPWKTIKQNILLGLKARNVPRKRSLEILADILKELGIESVADQYPANVSGGQKQRAAIARTIVLNPDILLMDEASSALDTLTKETIQDLILKIFLERHTTIVFITHSIEEAVFLGQNIVIMEGGKIKQILENPNVGIPDYRSKKDFFEVCAKVREALER
jgi:NitT/TauT family transport system ATP-binding protein